MAGLPGLPPPGFSAQSAQSGLPGLPAPGFTSTQEPTTPSLFKNPIEALTSADWWLTRPTGERIEPAQAVAAPMMSALEGLTLGNADEITALGSSLISGESYEDTLNKTRGIQKSFSEASPIVDLALQVMGGVKLPIPGGSKDASLLSKVVRGAGVGGTTAGIYGFSEGEEGFEKRLQSGVSSAKLGAGIGSAIPILGKVAEESVKVGKAFERSSIGATARNFIKSMKDKGLLIDDEADEVATKLSKSIEEIGDTEGFGFLRDPARLATRNKAVLKVDGKKIGDTLEIADQAGAIPKLDLQSAQSATQKLIQQSHAEKADIKGIVDEVKSKLFDPQNGWDGTVVGLNSWKTSLGNTGFAGTIQGTTKPSIERKVLQAVYKDIDKAIKDSVVSSGASSADDWSSLLKRYSNHKEIEPVLNYAAAGELGSTYDKIARGALRTSGGVLTTPTLIAGTIGGAAAGPVGLAIGTALGALSSPTGSGLAGNVLKVLGKAGSAVTKNPKTAASTALLSSVLGKAAMAEESPNVINKDSTNILGEPTMPRSPEFDAKVNDIAQSLEVDPEHLFKAMAFETGGTFDADVKNKAGSGATGLIQFMPSTAKELTGVQSKKAAIEILEKMTPTEQLDYVEKYLKPFKGKLNSIEDVYMAILYPKAVGKDLNYALFKEGTKAYWQNRGLDIDKDGVITKAEASQKVKNYNV